MDRQAALELLQEYTQKEGLLKHAYAVEAAMCAYARKFYQDETKFGIVGLYTILTMKNIQVPISIQKLDPEYCESVVILMM